MKISIITVCYNSDKTIEKTINSVLDQDYKNIEFLIVDDCSKDKTSEAYNPVISPKLCPAIKSGL